MWKFNEAIANLTQVFNWFIMLSIPATIYILYILVDPAHERTTLYWICWAIVVIALIIFPIMFLLIALNEPRLY